VSSALVRSVPRSRLQISVRIGVRIVPFRDSSRRHMMLPRVPRAFALDKEGNE